MHKNFLDMDSFNLYYRHYVYSSPLSSFFSVFYYSVAKHLEAEVLLSGQSADNMWDWGRHQIRFLSRGSHSSRIVDDIGFLFQPSVRLRTKARRLIDKYLARYAMIHSFEKMRFERFDEVIVASYLQPPLRIPLCPFGGDEDHGNGAGGR